jgi:hypothetical protein
MRHPMTEIVLSLPYDFNDPPNDAGFYEVVLNRIIDRNVHRGDTVLLSDNQGAGPAVLGRVRCLIAVVEPSPEVPDD